MRRGIDEAKPRSQARRVPATRYAKSGDVEIAYQTLGDGPIDLVWVAGFVTHLDVYWEAPRATVLLRRLASFSRLILFDKRGMGLSDHVRVAPLEERMDDVRAVMDAVGSQSAALIGVSEGGPMSILFAATYPERTKALILCGGEVKEERTEDWPWGEATWEEFEACDDNDRPVVGRGRAVLADQPEHPMATRRFVAGGREVQMNAMNPSAAVEFMRMGHAIDVRQVVPAVNVPTLVLHRVGDRVCHVENGRYVATHIDGAEICRASGRRPRAVGKTATTSSPRSASFLRARASPRSPIESLRRCCSPISLVRPLSCTDLGDQRMARACWSGTTRLSVAELGRFRGREIDTAGDGFLAAFDGPGPRHPMRSADRRGCPSDWAWRSGPALHTGECEVVGDKLVGLAVHIGARVAAEAKPSEVLVSRTVHDLVAGSGSSSRSGGLMS